MYKVIKMFHDAKSLRLMPEGMTLDWTDEERIKSALDRGLIEEVKEKKTEAKKEEKPKPKKAPAKKK